MEDKHNQTTLFKCVILSQNKLKILNENNVDRPTWLTSRNKEMTAGGLVCAFHLCHYQGQALSTLVCLFI